MISYYEHGKCIPSAEALIKLADAFDVSVDYFLFEDISRKQLRQTLDQETVDIVSKINQLSEIEKDSVLNILKSLVMKNKVKDLVSMVS
jgi:transcriptional regulator with XRE-family HTH domain